MATFCMLAFHSNGGGERTWGGRAGSAAAPVWLGGFYSKTGFPFPVSGCERTFEFSFILRHKLMLELSTAVQYVKGIGPRVAAALEQKGVATVEDLLYYLPFRYEDRQNPRAIDELVPGEMATVIGEVRGSGLFRTKAGLWIFNLTVGQGTQSIKAIWFHGQYMRDRFKPGQVLA